MVSAAYDRAQLWNDNEDFIVKLQSYARMHLARKAYKQRIDFMHNQVSDFVSSILLLTKDVQTEPKNLFCVGVVDRRRMHKSYA